MKKYFYSVIAAASMMLAVTSCSQEEDFAPQGSNEMTKFSISLNGAIGSRTAGDGKTAKNLYYEVYHGTNCIIDKMVTFDDDKVEYSIDVPLLKGEEYDIIFWAQAAEGAIYNVTDLKDIEVEYNNASNENQAKANQEAYDAFYNALNKFKADGQVHTIELRRPFAQLNLGTSDWEKAKDGLPTVDDGNGGTKKQYPVTATKAVVKGLATTFSPLTGEASGTANVTFDYAKLPAGTFDVGETTYKYLSLNYLLVPGLKEPQGLGEHNVDGNKTNVDIEFTLKRGENELFTIEVPNAPIQRNWRTNVIGDLLTGNRFDVVIKPETDDDNNVDIKNIKGLEALKDALNANTSTEQVIYDISGLSTTDNVEIEIPTTFVATQVTFNLNDIKNDANLTIKDADGGSYAGTVCVSLPTAEGHNLTATNINLPNGHVELLAGNFGDGTVTTSPTTLVVNNGAIIGELKVEGGNVEIQTGGEVESIEVSENIETPVIVALGEGVKMPEGVADNEKIIVAGADNAESNEETVYVAQVGDYKYTSLEDAVKVIATEGTIKMLADYNDAPSFTIPEGKNITLNLNGFTISGTDKTEKNYGLIQNNGVLTVTGNGTLKLDATINSGWSRYSAVISNNPGATLTVENGTIEHSGGTDMAYGIDNLTNGGIGDVNATINGGTIKSTYRAIRQFLNSDSKQNNLIINGGTIEGENKGIFFHDPSAKANNGKLVVGENSKVNSIYLFVTENSTHWPVEVSIAKSAVNEDGITSANVPEGYKVVEENDIFTVINYYNIKTLTTLKYFAEAVNGGKTFKNETVSLGATIDLNNDQWSPIGTEKMVFQGTFDGGNYTIKNLNIVETEAKEGKAYIGFFGYAKNVTIKNVTFENVNLNIACLDIDHSQGHIGAVTGSLEGTCTIENVTVKGDIKVEATFDANGASRVAVVAGGNVDGNVTMKNVHVQANEGSYLKANNNVGALAGQLQVKNVFENCSSNIDVTAKKFNAGGIIGLAAGNSTFTDCHTTGDITVTAGREGRANDHYRVGGIAGGWADGKTNVCTLTNCSYGGNISGTNADGSVADPLDYAGYVGRGYTLTNCGGSKVIIDGVSYVQKYNDKFGIYTIGGVTPVFTADELVEALDDTKQFKGALFMNDIEIDPANMSNAYGTTGINIKNGQTIDGGGFTLDIKGAGGTWDSGINTTGGLIKNLKVTGSFRGIFINHNSEYSETVVLENVTIDGTTYTISCDQGLNQNLEATNSTFKGWTSYAATLGNATFKDCKFGEGNGYAFCRPYAPTTFVGCNFEAGYEMDPRAAVTFENCKINGVALTADNLATLVTSNIANATVK